MTDTTDAARIAALELAANTILFELMTVRGKGPWFGGLLRRIQIAALPMCPPGEPTEADEKAWDQTVHATIYGVFQRILMDQSVPDFRHDAAISGAGTAHHILAPAVAAGYRIMAELALDSERWGREGQSLDLLEAEAIRQAKLQVVPSDAKGLLKERWVSASIAAIDDILARKRRANE
jgi:hypothetical protein